MVLVPVLTVLHSSNSVLQAMKKTKQNLWRCVVLCASQSQVSLVINKPTSSHLLRWWWWQELPELGPRWCWSSALPELLGRAATYSTLSFPPPEQFLPESVPSAPPPASSWCRPVANWWWWWRSKWWRSLSWRPSPGAEQTATHPMLFWRGSEGRKRQTDVRSYI